MSKDAEAVRAKIELLKEGVAALEALYQAMVAPALPDAEGKVHLLIQAQERARPVLEKLRKARL